MPRPSPPKSPTFSIGFVGASPKLSLTWLDDDANDEHASSRTPHVLIVVADSNEPRLVFDSAKASSDAATTASKPPPPRAATEPPLALAPRLQVNVAQGVVTLMLQPAKFATVPPVSPPPLPLPPPLSAAAMPASATIAPPSTRRTTPESPSTPPPSKPSPPRGILRNNIKAQSEPSASPPPPRVKTFKIRVGDNDEDEEDRATAPAKKPPPPTHLRTRKQRQQAADAAALARAAQARRAQIAHEAHAIHAQRKAARFFKHLGLASGWRTWRDIWRDERVLERVLRKLFFGQLSRAWTGWVDRWEENHITRWRLLFSASHLIHRRLAAAFGGWVHNYEVDRASRPMITARSYMRRQQQHQQQHLQQQQQQAVHQQDLLMQFMIEQQPPPPPQQALPQQAPPQQAGSPVSRPHPPLHPYSPTRLNLLRASPTQDDAVTAAARRPPSSVSATSSWSAAIPLRPPFPNTPSGISYEGRKMMVPKTPRTALPPLPPDYRPGLITVPESRDASRKKVEEEAQNQQQQKDENGYEYSTRGLPEYMRPATRERHYQLASHMSAFTLTKNMPWETYAVGARAQVKSKARTPAARGGRTPAVPRAAPGDGGGIVSGVVPPNLIDSSGMGAPGGVGGGGTQSGHGYRPIFTAETEEGSAAMMMTMQQHPQSPPPPTLPPMMQPMAEEMARGMMMDEEAAEGLAAAMSGLSSLSARVAIAEATYTNPKPPPPRRKIQLRGRGGRQLAWVTPRRTRTSTQGGVGGGGGDGAMAEAKEVIRERAREEKRMRVIMTQVKRGPQMHMISLMPPIWSSDMDRNDHLFERVR